MTTSEWYELIDESSDDFDLVRLIIVGDSDTADTLGAFLLEGLTDTDYLSELVRRHGLSRTADYVRDRRVPSNLNTRVADFGEVAAGRLLEAEEALLRPIEKLRYKFNHEWSPHLTDVLGVLVENGEITSFSYCEVKAGTTRPARDVGAKGYRDLVKAWQAEMPEILEFASERLWTERRFAEWERLDRAMAGAKAIPQLLRLVLVFDDDVWTETVLDDLVDAVDAEVPTEEAFVCYVVGRTDLRKLIEDAFTIMTSLATPA